jgi:hypothetical protein
MDMFRSWMGKEWVIRNMESVYPAEFQKEVHPSYNDTWPVVIVIRDYLNWAASWIKYRANSGNAALPQQTMDRAELWYQITREALGDTNYIANKYMLNYDLFVLDKKYREEVCEYLGGWYNEDKLDFVPGRGEGSSFDLKVFQGRGSEMDVINRWHWFLTEEGEPYQCHLKTRLDILEYYLDLWEVPPAKLRLVESLMASA